MNNRPILFFDSGIGGLNYLSWISERECEESFVYFADTENFPYGEKPVQELIPIILGQMRVLIEKVDPKMAVIACNTASVVALDSLRDSFNIPFIGTVPAIKPAAIMPGGKTVTGFTAGDYENTISKPRIGLLATKRTVNDSYTDRLIRDFAAHCEIIRFGAGELVKFIENKLFSSRFEDRIDVLTPITDYFREKRIQALVLGCTHFIFLKEEIRQLMGADVKIVDSVEGVGRQILRILSSTGRRDTKHHGADIFICTGGGEGKTSTLKNFAERFRLNNGGVI